MIESIRANMRDRMWSIKDVAAYYGCGLSRAKKITKQPGFPEALGEAKVYWDEDRVREWAETRVEVPAQPVETALYRHFASEGTLLYVGISLNQINRLDDHMKISDWRRAIARIEIEWLPAREDALMAESKAIATERPLHNKRGAAQ